MLWSLLYSCLQWLKCSSWLLCLFFFSVIFYCLLCSQPDVWCILKWCSFYGLFHADTFRNLMFVVVEVCKCEQTLNTPAVVNFVLQNLYFKHAGDRSPFYSFIWMLLFFWNLKIVLVIRLWRSQLFTLLCKIYIFKHAGDMGDLEMRDYGFDVGISICFNVCILTLKSTKVVVLMCLLVVSFIWLNLTYCWGVYFLWWCGLIIAGKHKCLLVMLFLLFRRFITMLTMMILMLKSLELKSAKSWPKLKLAFFLLPGYIFFKFSLLFIKCTLFLVVNWNIILLSTAEVSWSRQRKRLSTTSWPMEYDE